MLYANDLDSIRYSTFNASRPTQFLVHGFIDDGTVRWMKVRLHLKKLISGPRPCQNKDSIFRF